MTEHKCHPAHPEYYPVTEAVAKRAKITAAKYEQMYKESVTDPVKFWGEHGKRLDWFTPYAQVKDVDFADNARIRWYYDGTLNVAHNCIDRHLPKRANQVALIREGDAITIDAHQLLLQLNVDDAELARRRAAWTKPAPRYTRGVLAKFAKNASSASSGAVLDRFD